MSESESRTDPSISSDEEIEVLADRLVDALIVGGPASSPEPASAEPQPLKCRGIEVDGDHGEDIEDRLQSLFGDDPSPAAPVTPRADPVAAAPPATIDAPAIDEPAVEVEVIASVDVFGEQAPVSPTAEKAAPVAGQLAAVAPQPAIPWSQDATKARREGPRRSGAKKKWLAPALLVGGIASLAWLVLSPGSRPIEETTVTSVASTPRRASPPVTAPVEKPAPLAEPGPDMSGEASGRSTPVKKSNPATTAPTASIETPKKTAGRAAEAPARSAKPAAEKPSRPKPPPPKTASALVSKSSPRAAKTTPPATPQAQAKVSTKPAPTTQPPVTKAAAQPVSTTPPPVTIASNDPVTVEPPPAKANKPAASPPTPVAMPTQPKLISRPTPTYRKRDGPGVIVLKVLVSETGRVSRVVIKEGIPGSSLEASAIDVALRSTYRPATEDGQPVSAWTVERIEFE